MRIGIVGCEVAKFTVRTEAKAKQEIRNLLTPNDFVISGKCHLGGIDVWAIEIANELGLEFKEYPPKTLEWTGYKNRNLQIARNSEKVVCITLSKLPSSYKGMRFTFCYHCNAMHVKSGGCWTMKQAERLGKQTQLIVID